MRTCGRMGNEWFLANFPDHLGGNGGGFDCPVLAWNRAGPWAARQCVGQWERLSLSRKTFQEKTFSFGAKHFTLFLFFLSTEST